MKRGRGKLWEERWLGSDFGEIGGWGGGWKKMIKDGFEWKPDYLNFIEFLSRIDLREGLWDVFGKI